MISELAKIAKSKEEDESESELHNKRLRSNHSTRGCYNVGNTPPSASALKNRGVSANDSASAERLGDFTHVLDMLNGSTSIDDKKTPAPDNDPADPLDESTIIFDRVFCSVAGCAEHSDEEEKAYVGNSSESLADSATSGFCSWMRRAFRRGRKSAWFRAESLKETGESMLQLRADYLRVSPGIACSINILWCARWFQHNTWVVVGILGETLSDSNLMDLFWHNWH